MIRRRLVIGRRKYRVKEVVLAALKTGIAVGGLGDGVRCLGCEQHGRERHGLRCASKLHHLSGRDMTGRDSLLPPASQAAHFRRLLDQCPNQLSHAASEER